MRTVKILVGVAGAVLVLLVGALVILWAVVNPNDYKGRIAAAVTESTGRELILKGDIKLSVFPWVALELGPASLGNAPGFGDEPFCAFQRAAVRIRLFPLLAKRLEIERVDLDGLDLRLRRNAQGVGNWQDFGQKQPSARETGQSGGTLPPLARMRITHGRLSYQNLVMEQVDFQTAGLGANGVTAVRLSFDVNRGVLGQSVSLDAKFDVSAPTQGRQLNFADLNLSGLVNWPNDGRPAHWEMSAPLLEVDLAGQTLALPAFAFNYAGAHVTGKVQATKILDDLNATGSLVLAPVVLREVAPRAGIVLPYTRDPRALSGLYASSDVSFGADGVKLEQLEVQLDDTHLKGSAAFAGEPRALKFDLAVDQVDLDRYLSAEQGAAAPPASPASAPEKRADPDAAAPARGASALPDADGTLTVASLHFSPLDLKNVRLTLASKNNVAHLFPLLAQVDGGSYSGDVTLDRRGAIPVLGLDEHLSGIDMAQLLASTSYKGRLSGRGNVDLKGTAHGAGFTAFLQSLKGEFDANLANGALEGVDLGYELAAAQALLKHEAAPARGNPARTKFDAVKMSAAITNGVARTSDLTIASPALRVTGQGSANLVNKQIDFQLLASVLKAPGATLADIPLKITGTYADPTVRPDIEALAKGQLKQKLEDVLKKNGLEGLFGK